MSLGGLAFASGALLALAPLCLGLALWLGRGAVGAAEAPPHVALRLAGARGLSPAPARDARRRRGWLLGLGAALAAAALARPQWGHIESVSVERAREVLLALDLSRSMTADDVAPSRLARAKLLLESLLGELRGERVGLLVFAGTAFLQSPLSSDTEVLRDLLVDLTPESLPQAGTDYAALLRAALGAFESDGEADRFLVVLSDGESHDEAWRAWLPRLRERGVRVVALGIGTPEGAVLRDATGALLKDARGAAVLSRLAPETLRALASETGGQYEDAARWVDLPELLAATVARGRSAEFAEEREVRRRERFQWLLAPALGLLLLSAWLELPVVPRPRRLPRRASAGAGLPAALALALALGLALPPAPVRAAPAREAAPPERSPLAALVAELAAQPSLSAGDLARLAEATLAAAEPPATLATAVREGVVRDALAAVERGEGLDARAADWAELRRRLEALAHSEPPPSQPDAQGEEEPEQGEAGEEREKQGEGEGQGQDQAPSQEGGEGAQGEPDAQREPGAQGAPQQPPPAGADSQPRPDPASAGNEPPRAQGEPLDAEGGAQGAAEDAGGARPEEGDARDEPEAAPPETRLVGGGAADPEAAQHPELAETLGRLQRVRDRDSPARLFEAMQRAEGAPRSEPEGPAW